jgi:nucleotide-binding universal stress UspA family protein
VLVGIDGTASGLEALALAEAFAVLTGAPLLLGAVYGDEGGAFSDLIWLPRADAARWLEESSHRLGDLIPWSSETMRSNSPAHGVVEMAELEDARMIVLGSNRRGPLGRLLTGSTVRGVAHGAPCAVAVAPHEWRRRSPAERLTFGAAVDDSPGSYAVRCSAACPPRSSSVRLVRWCLSRAPSTSGGPSRSSLENPRSSAHRDGEIRMVPGRQGRTFGL